VATAENVKVPAVVGVPVISPVSGFKFKPGGKAPLAMVYVYGSVPPSATIAESYGSPVSPLAGHATGSGIGGFMVMPHSPEGTLSPSESVTSTVKLKVPSVVGVPVIAPVLGFRVRPGGKAPFAML
jgi:hypothetical protein